MECPPPFLRAACLAACMTYSESRPCGQCIATLNQGRTDVAAARDQQKWMGMKKALNKIKIAKNMGIKKQAKSIANRDKKLHSVVGHAVPTQTPAMQPSLIVDGFPSSHSVPSARGGWLHTPVDCVQTPMPWHWSCALHTTRAQGSVSGETCGFNAATLVT